MASHTAENVLSSDYKPPSLEHKIRPLGSVNIIRPLSQSFSSEPDNEFHKNGDTNRIFFIDKILENKTYLNGKNDQNEPIPLNEKFEMKEEPVFSPTNSLAGVDDDLLNSINDRTIGLSSNHLISNSDNNHMDPLVMEVDEIKEERDDMDVDLNVDGDERGQNKVTTVGCSLKPIMRSEVANDIENLRQSDVIPFEIKVEIEATVSECTEITQSTKLENIDESSKISGTMVRDNEDEYLENTNKPENYTKTIDESLKVKYDGMTHDSGGEYLVDTQAIKLEMNLETIDEIEHTDQIDVMNDDGVRIENEVMSIDGSAKVESDAMTGCARHGYTEEVQTTERESVNGRRDEKGKEVLSMDGNVKIKKEEINHTKDDSGIKHKEDALTIKTERQDNDFVKVSVSPSEEVIASLKRRWPDKFSNVNFKQQKIEIVCPRSSCTPKKIQPTTSKKARLHGYVQQHENTGLASWEVLEDEFSSSPSKDKEKNKSEAASTNHQNQPSTKTIMWMGIDSDSGAVICRRRLTIKDKLNTDSWTVTCKRGRPRKNKPTSNLPTRSSGSNAATMSQSSWLQIQNNVSNTGIGSLNYDREPPPGPSINHKSMQDIIIKPLTGTSLDTKTMQDDGIEPSRGGFIDPMIMRDIVIEPSQNTSIDPKTVQADGIEPSRGAFIDPKAMIMRDIVIEPSIDPKTMHADIIEPSRGAFIDPMIMRDMSQNTSIDPKTIQDDVIEPSPDAFSKTMPSPNENSEGVSSDPLLSDDINAKCVDKFAKSDINGPVSEITKHQRKCTRNLSVVQRIKQLLEKNSKILNPHDDEDSKCDLKINAVYSLAKRAGKERRKARLEMEKADMEKRIKYHYEREKLRLTHEKEVKYFNYEFDLSVSKAQVRLSPKAKEDDRLRMPCYVVLQTMELNKSTDCSKLCRRKVVKRLCQDLIARYKICVDGKISTLSKQKTERQQFVMMKIDGKTSLVPTKSPNSNIKAYVVESKNDADDVISWIKQKHNVVLLTPPNQFSATAKQTDLTTTCAMSSPSSLHATEASLSSNSINGRLSVSGNDKITTHSELESHFESSANITKKN